MTTTDTLPVVVEEAPAEPPVRARPGIAALFETALILAGLAAFAFLLPHYVINDALIRYQTLQALLHGELLPTKFTIVGHLFAAPLIWLAQLFGGDELTWAKMYNPVLFATAILALYLLLRTRLPGALLRRFFLVLIAGSMFAAHVMHFNSEVFTAMAVGVGLVAVATGGRSLNAWISIVLGVANTAAAVVPLALVVARRAWEDRRLRYGLALVAVVAIILTDNYFRRGGLFTTGYETDAGFMTVMPYSGQSGFSYPILFGLLSICFAFGKGLVFFAPGLLLPVRRTMRGLVLREDVEGDRADGELITLYRLYTWWLLFTAGLAAVYAPWWAWYGGMTWGPRFLLFASLPASLALAVRLWDVTGPLWQRALTLLVLALSAWVGFNAAAYPEAGYPAECLNNNFADEALCNYTPEFSALWYPIVFRLHLDTEDLVMAGYCALVFGYLALPLVRSIAVEVSALAGPVLAGARRGWRW